MIITNEMSAQLRLAAKSGVSRNLRLSYAMHKEIERQAKRHNVTSQNLIRILLEDALKRNDQE